MPIRESQSFQIGEHTHQAFSGFFLLPPSWSEIPVVVPKESYLLCTVGGSVWASTDCWPESRRGYEGSYVSYPYGQQME